jgi:hypothetical protein
LRLPAESGWKPNLLFVSNALEAHILQVENEAAWFGDARRLHRDNNVFTRASDRSGAGVLEAVFDLKLQRTLSRNFRRTLTVRGCAVAIDLSGIERNLDHVS